MKLSLRHAVVVALACTAACVSEEATQDDGAASASGEDAIEAEKELDPTSIAELRGAGFAEDEIRAVGESVVVSKRLALQSFVKEMNDGNGSPNAAVRRESHGKHQGCLRARVDVTAERGPSTFTKGASYPAWLRISNGGAYQKDDKATHISRGFAIKLLDVPASASHTHDLLFITSPRFFIHDIRHYPGFLRSTGNGRIGFFANLLFNMSLDEKLVILHRLSLKVDDMLTSPGYSAVPYAYGDEVVKYAIAPCDAGAPPASPQSHDPPRGAGDDYLEDAMNATLAGADPQKGVCYAMYVQRPRSEREDPIDNPTKAWEGAFDHVATITIPYGQHRGAESSYEKNDAACEAMSFDPWNAPADSHPVGKTNWTRKLVYARLAHYRRVDLPAIYTAWRRDPNDPSIPDEAKRELAKLRDPASAAPRAAAEAQPTIDDGFRRLGIVRDR